MKFVGSEEIHDTVFVVEKETKDAIYMKGNHFFLKSQISNIYSLYREEIELGWWEGAFKQALFLILYNWHN